MKEEEDLDTPYRLLMTDPITGEITYGPWITPRKMREAFQKAYGGTIGELQQELLRLSKEQGR